VCRTVFRAHQCKLCAPFISEPFQEASPRLPAPGYHHLSKPRCALLENTEELFAMFSVLGALQASTQMFLAVTPSTNMVMVTTHQQIVLNAFSYGVLHLVREAVGMYFQLRKLGAETSGGMLAGAARGHRGPPSKTSMVRTMISNHNLERLKVGCRHP